MFCSSLDGRGVWVRIDTCIWMAESLCCPTETVTTLWISYCCRCSVTHSCPTLCKPIDWSMPSSLSLTTSQSSPKFMSIASAMLSSHLIWIFPSLGDFSNESAVRIRWPNSASVPIPIPKKGTTKEYANHRTTTLISHASKVMLKILHARLQQYMNHELPDVQAGFRKGRGTRD